MLALVCGPWWSSRAAPLAQEAGPNLLQHPDFEWAAPWPFQDGNGAIQIANQWRAWWVDKPPASVARPYNCDGKDYGCYWAVPEFGDVQKLAHAYRVHGGLQSQKYFTYGRMHWAGLMQRVENIPPNARVRFSIYMQAWMCFEWVDCDYGRVSDQPADLHLKVGIDPKGGQNPFSPDVVWGAEKAAFDHWEQFQVEAVAQGGAVTVFTHSRPDWDWARKNNDVYVDDASLVIIGQAPKPTQAPAQAAQLLRFTSTPVSLPTATPTPAPTRTPTPTSTPTPTDTPIPTETPLRRVATLAPEDTATSAPRTWLNTASDAGGETGEWSGVIFLGAAALIGSFAAGVIVRRRRGSLEKG
jgi:hypothetical protein